MERATIGMAPACGVALRGHITRHGEIDVNRAHKPGRDFQPMTKFTLDRMPQFLSNTHMSYADRADLLFEALIVPHRSLTRRGWVWLVLGLIGAVALTVVRFVMLGAWPVAIFALLEVGLFLALFWLHARSMRQMELVLLSPSVLRVVRIDPRGERREERLQPGWLSVILHERPGRVPSLVLSSHGRQAEIAKALGEMEKRELAAALQTAIHDLRNPSFDNPQLRD